MIKKEGLDADAEYNYSVNTFALICEWDERKNVRNKRKHGVSFEEARWCFLDENAPLIEDPDHSRGDERFVLMGLSLKMRILVVCHAGRAGGRVIRIISARKATRREQAQYGGKGAS